MKITSENIFYVSGNAKEAVISRYFYFLLEDNVSSYDDDSDYFMLYKYISFSYSECNRLDAFIHSLISKSDLNFIRALEDYRAYRSRKDFKVIL
ncbi:hypothetical protein AB6S88_000890 [Escherichia coli]|uniref:hypothetical protein n=1 Tax=Escherichia TaxID=561 RepID=UPI00090786C1|nr:hypothetical protein [Escherichia coli]EET9800641.1 hypothetical protein [Escherichia coli]EFG1824692.1 hypothetical protein [Escherichia coli]EFU9152067.1 hypothetical protein [Escherichia coli]EHC2678005.1 hypothetical protein [Escherichia coli]EHF5381738.1 hypothetical protein [Escherichia coli]